jgi:carbon-monoxide dehydrogenase small subunit
MAPVAPTQSVRFRVNGRPVATRLPDTAHRLIDFLRDDLGLTGTKEACGMGVCGMCSVLIDDRLESACLTLVGLLDGRDVVTIEGLGSVDHPSHVQQAFMTCGGMQCGVCTPGQVVAATALLREEPDPSEDRIREWMAGNLCRCTGYTSIVAAIRHAAATADAP